VKAGDSCELGTFITVQESDLSGKRTHEMGGISYPESCDVEDICDNKRITVPKKKVNIQGPKGQKGSQKTRAF